MSEFEISLESLKEVQRLLTADFVKGLEREGDDVKVKMLVTYVHSMPDGTEEGDFLALDLGGSNFRVLLISELPASDCYWLCLKHMHKHWNFVLLVYGTMRKKMSLSGAEFKQDTLLFPNPAPSLLVVTESHQLYYHSECKIWNSGDVL